ncbi:ArdC-like ssDNA-binding domain-containing protein [Pseudomonas sp. DCB_CB]|uniref:ArdC-like ssDNA-binding domain-containing protein n=1 Tax=unclassified Pseudomonas TaxID=196821 RepID=UPI00224961AA|nr:MULTISPECIES: ArdC-like ssDNA-binding domain-containing protein [unclassified Pseudomonas]MCX2694476.1 ArdC-like ssDNA-binding domain-containing protein [Pseudomonas sp. DCB_BZ]MCX2859694.1 ArdC-like ssDNA-binding domain-containing protein [Pseudomonas sp. DCB_CB]
MSKTANRKSRKTGMSRTEVQQAALQNALADRSMANYEPIIEGFMEKGIPAEEITPRENVFTYNAWLALGRQVQKGESGVKVITYIQGKGKKAEAGEGGEGQGDGAPFLFPRSVTVFHISQTQPVEARNQ